MIYAILVSLGGPLNLWEKVIISTYHIQNKIQKRKRKKSTTPYELQKGYALT